MIILLSLKQLGDNQRRKRMIKYVMLCFALTTGLFADAWVPNHHQTKPEFKTPEPTKMQKVAEFPEFIDKVWQLAAVSQGVPYYLNLKEIKYDNLLKATIVYVKQYDLPNNRMRLLKYAYRNQGHEFAGLGMSVYDENGKFLNNTMVPLSQVEWSDVVPGTVAADILSKLRDFLEFVQREKEKGNTDASPSGKPSGPKA
jgi:hypothetical protein